MRPLQTLLQLMTLVISLIAACQAFAMRALNVGSPEEMESQLAQLQGEEEVLARANLIKALANSAPNHSQREWVINQQRHQGKIVRANPDHPNQ